MHHTNSLDTIAAALAYAMKIEAPACANTANADLVQYVEAALGEKGADRIFMYNPDAIADWVYRKYVSLLPEVTRKCNVEIPLASVMPSVFLMHRG